MMFGLRRGERFSPTCWTMCVGLALAFAPGLRARPAQAGHYTVAYSGGTATQTEYGGTSSPYVLDSQTGNYRSGGQNNGTMFAK